MKYFKIDNIFNQYLKNKGIDIEKEYKEYLQKKYDATWGLYKKEYYDLMFDTHNAQNIQHNNVKYVCKYDEYEKELSKYFEKNDELFFIDKKLIASIYINW